MSSSLHPRHTNTSNTIPKANNTRRLRHCNNLLLANSIRRRNHNTGNKDRKASHTKSLTSHRSSNGIISTLRRKGIWQASRNLLAALLQRPYSTSVPDLVSHSNLLQEAIVDHNHELRLSHLRVHRILQHKLIHVLLFSQ